DRGPAGPRPRPAGDHRVPQLSREAEGRARGTGAGLRLVRVRLPGARRHPGAAAGRGAQARRRL
ncbi:MAG: FIG002473: Protein YcaR in KDO2-Lipid A biosynthesis cluster, partial [uncultured Nocardioidaceae bacterium]